MNEQKIIEHRDPINGSIIRVQSVCVPARTLLQGAPFKMYTNTVLKAPTPQKKAPLVRLPLKGFK